MLKNFSYIKERGELKLIARKKLKEYDSFPNKKIKI